MWNDTGINTSPGMQHSWPEPCDSIDWRQHIAFDKQEAQKFVQRSALCYMYYSSDAVTRQILTRQMLVVVKLWRFLGGTYWPGTAATQA